MPAKETERQLKTISEQGWALRGPRAHAVAYLENRSIFISFNDGQAVVLGRSDEADVELDTGTVSREHAVMRWANGELTIEDLGSRNGTYVNGEPAHGEMVLTTGDEIALGDAQVVVGVTSPPVLSRRIVPSYEDFSICVDHELAQAARLGRRPLLLRLDMAQEMACDGGGLSALLAALPGRVLASTRGPRELLALVIGASAPALRAACRAVVGSPAWDAAGGRFAVAEAPRDGHDLASLLRHVEGVDPDRAETDAGVVDLDEADLPIMADPVTQRLFSLAERIAPVEATVLILGETGVGKDLVARYLHRRSPRHRGPLVHINCGAIPSAIFEREMFGHERGAFTGAREQRIGLFEAAASGTLFLDEIAEIPLGDQVRLLRAIEHRSIVRVGGVAEIPVDIRIVAATNRDLEDRVAQGLFREDLFYRLNGLTIFVPALRDRTADVEPLARAFFARVKQASGRQELSLADGAVRALERYGWPGNIRELRNVVERATLLAGSPIVDAPGVLSVLYGEPMSHVPFAFEASLKTLVEEVERHALTMALDGCGQNQSLAAERLGISRRSLIYKMRRYGFAGRGRGSR